MSRWKPLPPDLDTLVLDKTNLQYKGFYKGADEWSSSCNICHEAGHDPSSGKPDRMYIRSEANGYDSHIHCRQCGHHEFVGGVRAEPKTVVQIKHEDALRRAYQKRESERRHEQIKAFQQSAIWQYYHSSLTKRARLGWRRAGIPDSLQDYWVLGWTDNYTGKDFNSPAYTIPYFSKGFEAQSLQFRLVKPARKGDKYRFLYGLHQELFLPEPDREFKGKCLLVEGAKKSMVAWHRLVAEAGYHDWSVVAVPAAQSYSLLPQLEGFEAVWVVLDPDQYVGKKNVLGHEGEKPIERFLARLKDVDIPEIFVAKPPTKVDDAFVKYKATAKDFMAMINQAWRYHPQKSYSV